MHNRCYTLQSGLVSASMPNLTSSFAAACHILLVFAALLLLDHQEFVLREFQEVYGPHNVVAVQIVSYSPRTAKLVMQYNTTRLALEDLLDDYSKQLHEAVAAAGRRKKRSQAASLLAAPFVRCCGNGQQQQHLGQQHAPLQAIKVRTVSNKDAGC